MQVVRIDDDAGASGGGQPGNYPVEIGLFVYRKQGLGQRFGKGTESVAVTGGKD